MSMKRKSNAESTDSDMSLSGRESKPRRHWRSGPIDQSTNSEKSSPSLPLSLQLSTMMCLVLLVDEVVHWNSSLSLAWHFTFTVVASLSLSLLASLTHSPNPPARERGSQTAFSGYCAVSALFSFPSPLPLPFPFTPESGRRQCTSTAAKVCAIISLLLGEAAAASW